MIKSESAYRKGCEILMSDLKTAVKDQLLARKYTMVRTQNEEIIFFLKEAGGTVECLCLADDRGGALERFGYGFYDRLSVVCR